MLILSGTQGDSGGHKFQNAVAVFRNHGLIIPNRPPKGHQST